MHRTIILTAAALATIALTGCASTETASDSADVQSVEMVNTVCPISGHPAKAEYTVSYQGQTVGMCCAGCVTRFDGFSDQKKAEMVAAATK